MDFARAQEQRKWLASHLDNLLCDNAVLLIPTVSGPALSMDAPSDAWDDRRTQSLPLLCISGIAGLPQISMPVAAVGGCSLGVSLIAARGKDTMLLDIPQKVSRSF
jgi:amidase